MKKLLTIFLISVLFCHVDLICNAQTYCRSNGINPVPGYISQFQIGSFNNVSTYAASGYSDFTSLNASVPANNPANISITNSRQNISNYYYYTVWIDYNNNGVFTDAGETVLSQPNSTSSQISSTITIPGNVNGIRRVRVSMSYLANLSCGSFNFGEVEDYNVNFICPTPNSFNVTGPSAFCSNPPAGTISIGLIDIGDDLTFHWSIGSNTSGATITSPNPATFININTTNSNSYFVVNVYATNSCGASSAVMSHEVDIANGIVPATPPAPTIMGGNSTICHSSSSIFQSGMPTSNSRVWSITPTNAYLSATPSSQYGGISNSVIWNPGYSGAVNVSVAMRNGCGTSHSSNPLAINIVSCRISDEDEGTLSAASALIFPNPADKGANLLINSMVSAYAIVKVYDIRGVLVYENDNVITRSEFTFGENLTAGIYTVKVEFDGTQKNLRFIKN